ncbi:MAG: RHS repeat-associated core domain-containing protein [Patescibacteria group bacterium]
MAGISSGVSGASLQYSYDAVGNVLSDGTNAYSYDPLGRLTGTDRGDGIGRKADRSRGEKLETAYSYDGNGNRDAVEQTFSKTNKKGVEKEKTRVADYSANALDQYSGVAFYLSGSSDSRRDDGHGKKTTSFRYDKNGNLVDDGNREYSYDYRNRLTKVESYGTEKGDKVKKIETLSEFRYDPLGRRTEKISYDDGRKDSATRYLYAGQDALEEDDYPLEGKRETLSATREYVYGNGTDDALAAYASKPGAKGRTTAYFYHKDRLGSVAAVTDARGKAVARYAYDEFGRTFSKNPAGEVTALLPSPIGDSRLYTGREYDRETGLYYYRARYYSADLGRFLSRDPIGTADQINPYAYVANNPLKYVDSMGMEKIVLAIYETAEIYKRLLNEPL